MVSWGYVNLLPPANEILIDSAILGGSPQPYTQSPNSYAVECFSKGQTPEKSPDQSWSTQHIIKIKKMRSREQYK